MLYIVSWNNIIYLWLNLVFVVVVDFLILISCLFNHKLIIYAGDL